jgi:hypothetical protein
MYKVKETRKCDCGHTETRIIDSVINKSQLIETYKCFYCRNKNKPTLQITHAQQLVLESDYDDYIEAKK